MMDAEEKGEVGVVLKGGTSHLGIADGDCLRIVCLGVHALD